jgi:hypothetical protein
MPNDHSELHIKVFAPREPEARDFAFAHNVTVGEAAEAVALAFGYAPGTPSFQTADGTVLERDKNLAAAHVKDGDTLELVDAGGGV